MEADRARKYAVRRIAMAVALTLVAILGLAAWRFLPGRRAEVRLSSRSPEAVPRFTLPAGPIHLQADPLWGNDRMGGSGEPLRWVGCTVCCLNMALAHHGEPQDPAMLNRLLKASDGYTYRGWVRLHRPSHRDIDAALAEGSPVLVKLLLRSGIQHGVLLVGRDQKEYLMKDPAGDGVGLRPLSVLDSDILAVRVVRRM